MGNPQLKPKPRPKPVYSVHNGCAQIVQHGYVNDSIGRVAFREKAATKIYLENISSETNKALAVPFSQKIVEINGGGSNSIDCFYNLLSQVSIYYSPTTTDDKSKPTYEPLTSPTINVYYINLGQGINTLEIRNNDPWSLKGLDSAPFDQFSSLAISNSEVATIKGIAASPSNSLLLSSITFNLDNATPVLDSGGTNRTYYTANLTINGSVKGNTKATSKNVPTNVVVYSIDQRNWISVAYANAASSIISYKTIWGNQIIPIPTGTNPFNSNWSALLNKLTLIKSDADALAPTGLGSRLFKTEIRDYIYQGNLDNVTFQMAFRLPFFAEDPNVTPYQNHTVTTPSGDTSRINNPYYTKFETWFGYANAVRTSANRPLLARTGLLESFTDSIQAAPDNLSLYNLFGVVRDSSLTNHHIPAYIAAIMGDENGLDKSFDAYFTIPSQFKKHLRENDAAKTAARSQKSLADLSGLVHDGYITQDSYNTLTQTPDGQFGAISFIKGKGSLSKGYYIYKSAIDNNFYVYDKITATYWKGNSGLTIAFGYDMGGRGKSDYGSTDIDTSLVYVTGLTGISADQQNAIKLGFGLHQGAAVALFYTYFDTVFSKVNIKYDWAVSHAQPLMKKSYLSVGIGKDGLNSSSNPFFQVYDPTPNLNFYDAGANQYFNEVEKYVYGTQLYNAGAGSFDPGPHKARDSKTGKVIIDPATNKPKIIFPYLKTAMYFTHAVNTHDIRWMKEFLRPGTGPKKDQNLATHMWRRGQLKSLLEKKSVYDHYINITKTSL